MTTLIKDAGLTVQVNDTAEGANVTVRTPGYFAAAAEFEERQRQLYASAQDGHTPSDPRDQYRVDLGMFDPTADHPILVPAEQHLDVVGAWLASHGTHPAVVYAFEQTGLTPDVEHMEDPDSAQEWLTAVLSWWRDHSPVLACC